MLTLVGHLRICVCSYAPCLSANLFRFYNNSGEVAECARMSKNVLANKMDTTIERTVCD